jgi:hypothetical protein
MPITTREARRLSTAAEWTLIESSLPGVISTLSPARLKVKIARARKLRDKYSALVQRQHDKAQAIRTGMPNEALNARTKRKVALFTEVLARYEARLATPAPRTTKAAAKTPRRRPTSSVAPSTKMKASPTPVVSKGELVRRSGQVRTQAHVASRGRRRQGKRDSR